MGLRPALAPGKAQRRCPELLDRQHFAIHTQTGSLNPARPSGRLACLFASRGTVPQPCEANSAVLLQFGFAEPLAQGDGGFDGEHKQVETGMNVRLVLGGPIQKAPTPKRFAAGLIERSKELREQTD